MAFFYLALAISISTLATPIFHNPEILSHNLYFTATLAGLIGFSFVVFVRGVRANRLLKRAKKKQALTHLSWQEYESLCNDYLTAKGIKANLSKAGADGGIDIHAHWNGKKIIVQCKHWKKPVGVSTVREMYGLLHEQKAAVVIVFSSGSFTKPAWLFAKGKPIYLITGDKLLSEIRKL
jgi:restriction system protein